MGAALRMRSPAVGDWYFHFRNPGWVMCCTLSIQDLWDLWADFLVGVGKFTEVGCDRAGFKSRGRY